MDSFFSLMQVQWIGNIALGSFGFFLPYTGLAMVRYLREQREIRLDENWAEFERRTGKKEPAENKARDRRNYRSGETRPRVPARPQTASKPAPRPAALPVAPKPATRPVAAPKASKGPKAWDKWSEEI